MKNFQHTGVGKSVLELRNPVKNLDWRALGFEQYKERFLSQLKRFRSKQHLAVKGTRHWRFFGDMRK